MIAVIAAHLIAKRSERQRERLDINLSLINTVHRFPACLVLADSAAWECTPRDDVIG
jgi:hypothetical protein